MMAIDNDTVMRFRNVLAADEDGRYVLTVLLTDLGFFSEIEPQDPAAAALRNYAARLLSYLGINYEQNAMAMVEALTQHVRPVRFNACGDEDHAQS